MKARFLESKFIDYQGKERVLTTCAYVMYEDKDENNNFHINIGFSLQHQDDKFNRKIGKQIALNKAKNMSDDSIYISPGTDINLYINNGLINCILKQYSIIGMKNTAYYFEGYKQAEIKFKEHNKKKEEYINLFKDEIINDIENGRIVIRKDAE